MFILYIWYGIRRQLDDGVGGGVPKNMAMLLVRQEIMGNNLSAVETVLKSDVKREGVKRWIEWIENELTKLDNPEEANAAGEEGKEEEKQKSQAKGKQRLKDRKKNKAVSAAASKKSSSKKKSKEAAEESIDEKRKRLNSKLANAYERLARIEQEEGDPEPRARRPPWRRAPHRRSTSYRWKTCRTGATPTRRSRAEQRSTRTTP